MINKAILVKITFSWQQLQEGCDRFFRAVFLGKRSKRSLFWGSLLGLIVGGFFAILPQLTRAESCIYHENAYEGLNPTRLSQELEKTGLIGEIHGAVPPSQLYVLSVREPNNFFKFQHFSLISADSKTQKQLAAVTRHDQVCIQGKWLENPSPQPHILVKSLQILDHWTGLDPFPAYEGQKDLPESLKHQTQLIGKVHAIEDQGRILVIEYQDAIFPLFVPSPELTHSLYRGDIIRLQYQLQSNPQQPTHLQLNLTTANPLEVIEAIANQQGQNRTLQGKLVKFPQSPQLKFDVYGIEVMTQGIPLYFTLVNFEDREEFENIRQKLTKIWDENVKTQQSGRNMLINPEVIIEAQGKLNIISPNQANPQILLENADKIRQVI